MNVRLINTIRIIVLININYIDNRKFLMQLCHNTKQQLYMKNHHLSETINQIASKFVFDLPKREDFIC